MLYAFVGDREKAKDKARALERSLLARNTEAGYFVLDEESVSDASLSSLVSGQGLFSQKYIVRLNGVFKEKETAEVVLGALVHIASSENIFVLVEGALPAPVLKKVEKYAEKVVICEASLPKKGAKENPFALTEAFSARDKQALWMHILGARMRDTAPEDTHGLLLWQYRQWCFAKVAEGPEDAGMKPFVYTKSKKALARYSEEELKDIGKRLIRMNHDARRGIVDLSAELERFALSL